MLTDTQVIVKLFCEKNNIKLNKTQFGRQLGIASNLLKDYKMEDIVMVINYLFLFPPKKPMFSVGYLAYVMDENIDKAKNYFYPKENIEMPIKEIENIEVKNDVINKKSMFSKNRRF